MTVNEIKDRMAQIDLEWNRNTALLYDHQINHAEWNANIHRLNDEYQSLEVKLKELSK